MHGDGLSEVTSCTSNTSWLAITDALLQQMCASAIVVRLFILMPLYLVYIILCCQMNFISYFGTFYVDCLC
jgi:hypothetical protein